MPCFEVQPDFSGDKVLCPYCKVDDDKVVDSRSSDGGQVIRRRRCCLNCGKRFTTYEKVSEEIGLSVVKKDNTRVPYDRQKLISGLEKACYKRPISVAQIRSLADKVEEEIFRHSDKEVSSRFIGKSVMDHLRLVDKVAYIRFASVYREFNAAEDFIDEASMSNNDYSQHQAGNDSRENHADGTGDDSRQTD
jgi:transcriptional repressor NrdR